MRVPIDHARMGTLANFLERLPRIEKAYSEEDDDWQGMPGSQAEHERQYLGPDPANHPWTYRIISTAYATVHLLLSGASEQALAVARLITDPTIGFHGLLGVDACTRSAVELCAKAFWLMDPKISAHERGCRSLAEQLSSSIEAESLAKAMGWTKPVDEMGISATSASVKGKCRSLGLRPKVTDFKASVDGHGRPSATVLITELVEATPYKGSKGMVYKVLSATNHGTLFGLLRSYESGQPTKRGEETIKLIADHRSIEASVGLVMMCFMAVLDRVVTVMGWSWYRVSSATSSMCSLLSRGPR